MGLLIERMGLNRGVSVVVGLWSAAGVATGFTGGLGGSWPAATPWASPKARDSFLGEGFCIVLKPHERAMGTAVNQLGVTLGMMGAPLLAGWVAMTFDGGRPSSHTGLHGFLWIPLWLKGPLAASRPPPLLRRAARSPRPAARPPPVGAGRSERSPDGRSTPLDELDDDLPGERALAEPS